MPLWGRDCPLPTLVALAPLSLEGDGPVHIPLPLLTLLFCEQAWRYLSLGLFTGVAFPGVWFAISSWFPQIALWAFRPCPYSKQCSPHLPAQPLLASGGRRHLHCFSAESYHWACTLSSQLCCPLRFQGSPQTHQWECSLVFGNLYLFKDSLPGKDLHPYLFCLSFYLLHFFLPPFEDNWQLF